MLFYSQEVLVQELIQGSSKSLSTNPGEETFWVPQTSQKQSSFCQSDNEADNTSQGKQFAFLVDVYLRFKNKFGIRLFLRMLIILEDSMPESPTSSNSYQPFIGSVPFARNEKQVVLTNSSPVRPKVSSMQSKLDHTKIDTSLYQKVIECI